MTNRTRHMTEHSPQSSHDIFKRIRQPLFHSRLPALGLVLIVAFGIVLLAAAITQAPVSLSVGTPVRVANVGEQELNIRSLPGIANSQVLFRAAEGSAFRIIGGPRQADGFTWWHIQDPLSQLAGWAAADYLQAYQVETGQ